MGYKRKWNIKNNSFIQYFNKLHEKKKEKKMWELHLTCNKKEKEKRKKWYLKEPSGLARWAVSLGLAQPAPLGCANPACHSNW